MADFAAASASQAGFQVLRVGDEAVPAQWPALLVAGDRLSSGTATRALFGPRMCDAGAADSHPIERLVESDDPVATGTRGSDHPLDPSSVQQIDEPQDRTQRRKVAISGEQCGLLLQGPGQLLAMGGTRRHRPDGARNAV
jgi:hypothetical protein